MRPLALVLAVLGLPVVALVACGGDAQSGARLAQDTITSDGGCASVHIVAPGGQLVRGDNHFVVQLAAASPATASATPTPITLVDVSAFMVSMGHGTDRPQISRSGDDWSVSHLELPMAGRWEITLSMRCNGQTDAARFRVDLP